MQDENAAWGLGQFLESGVDIIAKMVCFSNLASGCRGMGMFAENCVEDFIRRWFATYDLINAVVASGAQQPGSLHRAFDRRHMVPQLQHLLCGIPSIRAITKDRAGGAIDVIAVTPTVDSECEVADRARLAGRLSTCNCCTCLEILWAAAEACLAQRSPYH